MTTLNTIIEEENTPDTEWETEFEEKFFNDALDAFPEHPQTMALFLINIKTFIATLLTSRDTYWKERVRKEVESKDGAYHERNVLVCALTKLFPAYLARHNEDDKTWERDWMWIVYIDLPTGQVSWHIHDSEREMFNHLEVKENNWDGHNTERKYQRLQALDTLLDNLK